MRFGLMRFEGKAKNRFFFFFFAKVVMIVRMKMIEESPSLSLMVLLFFKLNI